MSSCSQFVHDQTRKALPIKKWKSTAGIVFRRQCPKCQKAVGPKLRPTDLEEFGKIIHPRAVPWSEAKKPFQGQGNVKKKTYKAYLRTSVWKRKRDAVLERDQWMCFGCGEIADQVDHIVYPEPGELGTESLDTLRASCGDCNQQARQDRIGGGG